MVYVFIFAVFDSFPMSHVWFQPIYTSNYITHSRPSGIETERETGIGRNGVLVYCICRDSAAICPDLLIMSLCCCTQEAFQQQVSVVCLQRTRTSFWKSNESYFTKKEPITQKKKKNVAVEETCLKANLWYNNITSTQTDLLTCYDKNINTSSRLQSTALFMLFSKTSFRFTSLDLVILISFKSLMSSVLWQL